MRSVRATLIVVATMVFSGLVSGPAHARPAVQAGGYLSTSFPTGEWGEVAGFGIGLENAATVFPDSSKAFGIRQGSSLIYNFGRTVDVPSAQLDTNTSLEIETARTSLWFGIGPAFAKQTGNHRPFLYGTIGVTFNWIDSHLKGDVQGSGYDATVGQTSTTFTWTVGGGLSKAYPSVPGGRLELSAEYRANVDQDYLLPKAVSSSGSSVSWKRTPQDAYEIIVRLGIAAGG